MSASDRRIQARIILVDPIDGGVLVDEIAHVVVGAVRDQSVRPTDRTHCKTHVFLLTLPGRMAE